MPLNDGSSRASDLTPNPVDLSVSLSPDTDRPGVTVSRRVHVRCPDGWHVRPDEVITEEPMEIRVMVTQDGRWTAHSIAVTMRTPGHDYELAAGFLFTEGVITHRDDVVAIRYCPDPHEPQRYNVVSVYLRPGMVFDVTQRSRHVLTSSSCGVCGQTTLDWVRQMCTQRPRMHAPVSMQALCRMYDTMVQAQRLFARTGGLHASALFDRNGRLLYLREDVGRHNAMDKLVGALLLQGALPADDTIVLVSGRAGFELVQKAIRAGIPMLVAVGAPTSLAVQLAENYGMTLIGFFRNDRCNVYTGIERIRA